MPKKFSTKGELECCHCMMIFTQSMHYTSPSLLNIKDHGTNKSEITVSQLWQFLSTKNQSDITLFQGMKRVIFFNTIAWRKFNRAEISFLLPCLLTPTHELFCFMPEKSSFSDIRHVPVPTEAWWIRWELGHVLKMGSEQAAKSIDQLFMNQLIVVWHF